MVQLVRVESTEDFNQNGTQYYRLLNLQGFSGRFIFFIMTAM